MKRKGSFGKRAGNFAVFLLRNVLYVLGAVLVSFLIVRFASVLTGEAVDSKWRVVLLELSIAAALIGCSILFGFFPFPYTCIWHDYNGCKCRICGETDPKRHDFDGCKCRICGETRDEGHNFDGCTCRKCGKTRDEGHDFDGCTCRKCGKEVHDWQEISRNVQEVMNTYVGTDIYGPDAYHLEGTITYRCRRCGKTRTETNWSNESV